MQLKLEHDPTLDDISVLIRYVEKNQMLGKLVNAIKALGEKVQAQDEDKTIILDITNIYYFESVDKKTFAYCRENVYRVSDRLYQLKDRLERFGFAQVSKACLLNINKLANIRNMMNSKMEATLSNGERISVSRKYIAEIKEAIKTR